MTDLVRQAVVFEPGDPPREGRMAFLDPDGDATVPVVEEHGGELRVLAARATHVPVADAVAGLARARSDAGAHPAARFWGAVALVALQLVARGRILPGVSAGDFDSWRAGPFDAADVQRIRELADAMPAAARSVPFEDRAAHSGEVRLRDAESLVRAFLDAVADAMPRSPGAVRATGTSAFAAVKPVKVPRLRAWADEVSAGLDSGVRLSLRLEADSLEQAEFRAVVQLHSLADPTLVADAADAVGGHGPRVRAPRPDRRHAGDQAGRPRLGRRWNGCSTAPSPTCWPCPTRTWRICSAGPRNAWARPGSRCTGQGSWYAA